MMHRRTLMFRRTINRVEEPMDWARYSQTDVASQQARPSRPQLLRLGP
jgi:hypothetical protein